MQEFDQGDIETTKLSLLAMNDSYMNTGVFGVGDWHPLQRVRGRASVPENQKPRAAKKAENCNKNALLANIRKFSLPFWTPPPGDPDYTLLGVQACPYMPIIYTSGLLTRER